MLPVSLVSRRLPRHPVIVLLWDWLRSLPIRREWISTQHPPCASISPSFLIYLVPSTGAPSRDSNHRIFCVTHASSLPIPSTNYVFLASFFSTHSNSLSLPQRLSLLASSFPLTAMCVRNPCLSAVIHASRNIVQWIYPSAKGAGWRQDALAAGMYGYLRFKDIE